MNDILCKNVRFARTCYNVPQCFEAVAQRLETRKQKRSRMAVSRMSSCGKMATYSCRSSRLCRILAFRKGVKIDNKRGTSCEMWLNRREWERSRISDGAGLVVHVAIETEAPLFGDPRKWFARHVSGVRFSAVTYKCNPRLISTPPRRSFKLWMKYQPSTLPSNRGFDCAKDRVHQVSPHQLSRPLYRCCFSVVCMWNAPTPRTDLFWHARHGSTSSSRKLACRYLYRFQVKLFGGEQCRRVFRPACVRVTHERQNQGTDGDDCC